MLEKGRASSIPKYLNLQEVARYLSLSPRTIRTHITDAVDPLPAFRIRGKFIVKWSEVEEWVDRHRVSPLDVGKVASQLISQLDAGHSTKSGEDHAPTLPIQKVEKNDEK